MEQTINIKGRFRLVIRDAEGNLKDDSGWIDNIVTTVGKAELANLAGNVSSPTAFTYLAVGTSATAVSAADTTLTAEITDTGLARHAATVTRVTTTTTNDTLQLAYTWTASGSKIVEETGILNASSSGTLLTHGLTTTKTLANTDTLAITYQLKFS